MFQILRLFYPAKASWSPHPKQFYQQLLCRAIKILTVVRILGIYPDHRIAMEPSAIHSEGGAACYIIQNFQTLSISRQRELLMPKPFQNWLQHTLKVKKGSTARVLAVIRHDKFCQLAVEYCQTSYGKAHFSWSLMERIISSKLDFV